MIMVRIRLHLRAFLFLIIPFIQYSNSLEMIHLNENYLDVLNNKDGSDEKPFNKISDIFGYSLSNMIEIDVQSNFLCNETFYNNGSKIFRLVFCIIFVNFKKIRGNNLTMIIGSNCYLMTVHDRLDFNEIHILFDKNIKRNPLYFSSNSSINFYVKIINLNLFF